MTDVSNTQDNDAAKAARGDQLAGGFYRFTTDQARGVEKANKNGYRQVTVKGYPLRDPDDVGSADFRVVETLWITLPLRNPDIEGHTVDGKTLRDAAVVFGALFPERIPFVGRTKPEGGYKTDEEYEAEKTLQLEEVQAVAREVLADPDMLNDRTFFAKATPKEKGKGCWLNNLSADNYAGTPLTSPEKFIA